MTPSEFVWGTVQGVVVYFLVEFLRRLRRRRPKTTAPVSHHNLRVGVATTMMVATMLTMLTFFALTFIFPTKFEDPIALAVYHWAFPVTEGVSILVFIGLMIWKSVEERSIRQHRLSVDK